MPIDSVHPQYAANIARWKRCRDAYEGEDAVKAAKDEYLPRLSGQTGEEYAAYVKRALYYEAVGRSIDGYVGAVARKPPVIKLPEKLAVFEKDTTTSGIGLAEFIKKLCSEDLLQGRAGIFVDYDEASQRAYLSFYVTESITNWDADFIVLKEVEFIPGDDRFSQKAVDQYRELTIENGVYTVNIWRKKESATGQNVVNDEWAIVETTTPNKRKITRSDIPFFWLSCFGQSDKIEKPPLLGLVNVAVSHYRSSADLEHGRHFTGLPTLYVAGITESTNEIRVGSSSAILLSDPAAKAAYAEFTGQGLGSLEKALESKEHMMAVLGGAVFADQRKGVEAAETARIRSSGETSLLMGVVNSVEETLEAALLCAAEWMGATGEIDISINRDFIDTTLDPMMLAGLVKAYQAQTMSLDTFIYNLRQAEMINPDTTDDEEKAAIKAGAPTTETVDKSLVGDTV